MSGPKSSPSVTAPELLTPTQVCDYLQISSSTLRRLVASEELTAYRLGRSRTRRFRREDLEKLLTPENQSAQTDALTDYIWGRVG